MRRLEELHTKERQSKRPHFGVPAASVVASASYVVPIPRTSFDQRCRGDLCEDDRKKEDGDGAELHGEAPLFAAVSLLAVCWLARRCL